MDEEISKAIEEAVHIMQQQAQEQRAAAADPAPVLASASQSPQDQQPSQDPPQEPRPPDPGKGRRRGRARSWLRLAGLVAGISSATALVVLLVQPLVHPTALVTIIPATRTLETSMLVQVPGHALPTVTLQEVRTVPTTGTGHQPAQAASGMVTLYNAAPYAQTIPAGTLLTGADGVQVVTVQEASIPAGNLATNGQVSVLAQALQPGPAGNIRAGALYGPCCRADVFVTNRAFTGGQNARTFPMVTAGDLARATTDLTTALSASMQAVLKAQLQPGEALASPTCHTTTGFDHQAGEEASALNGSMTQTCQGWAYQTEAVQAQLRERLSQQAHQLGDGYILSSEPQSSILVTSRISTTLSIEVKGQAQVAYQFSQRELAAITRTIAGMPKAQATAWVAQQPGVQAVSIEMTGNGTTLPQEAGAIRCTLLSA